MLLTPCGKCGMPVESTHPLIINDCLVQVCPRCAMAEMAKKNNSKNENLLTEG